MINNLDVQPEIFPTTYGSIQIEYHKNDNTFLEIEIGVGSLFQVYKVINAEETLNTVFGGIKEVKEIINNFISMVNLQVEEENSYKYIDSYWIDKIIEEIKKYPNDISENMLVKDCTWKAIKHLIDFVNDNNEEDLIRASMECMLAFSKNNNSKDNMKNE